jgi:hypothetical protein
VKDEFFQRGSFSVGNGLTTQFWEDSWLGNSPLSVQYPALFNKVAHRNVRVADVLSQPTLNITFNRILRGSTWENWLSLVERLMEVQLNDQPDSFCWNLTTSGKFSVKSLYTDFMSGHTRFLKKYLWKLKVPLKIRIFMWFLNRKVLLTKDNLAKRKWTGCTKCVFCDSKESIEHLFIRCPFASLLWRVIYFTFNIPAPTNIKNLFGKWLNGIDKIVKEQIRIGVCALLWAIWNCRNDIVFNGAGSSQFLQAIHRTTYWINMWSHLLPEDQRAHMDSGCTRLMAVVRAIFNQGGWRHINRLQDV